MKRQKNETLNTVSESTENTAEPLVEKFKQPLRCKLSDEELIQRGEELAEAQAEVNALTEALASVRAEYKAKIEHQEAKINVLSGTIRAKSEIRTTECERVFDYQEGTVSERRLDTGETLRWRELEGEERQQKLAV